jgi:D-psicose/D-tagatose/L-ribulose 3-epimerase
MRFGLNTFLYASPFTNASVSMFKKLKKWGFDTVEIAIEDPAHVDPAVPANRCETHYLCATIAAFA